jgi:hypothetical protein
MSFRERLDVALGRRRWTIASVTHDSGGIQLSWSRADGREGTERVAWERVCRVVAYKRDLFATDLVCLGIEDGDGPVLELDEEMPGWESLLTDLPVFLRGALDRDRLLAAVVQPPFATSETTVYERAGHAAG